MVELPLRKLYEMHRKLSLTEYPIRTVVADSSRLHRQSTLCGMAVRGLCRLADSAPELAGSRKLPISIVNNLVINVAAVGA